MRYKFVYSCSIKTHAERFDILLEGIFCLLLSVKAFPLKSCGVLEEVVAGWQEVRWIWRMRQNFIAQIIQFWSIGCMTWGGVLSWRRIGPFLLTCAGYRCCSLQCISSICWACFSCTGFIGIQKATVDQMCSRPPNSDHDVFWVQVWFWEMLWTFLTIQPLSWSSLVVI